MIGSASNLKLGRRILADADWQLSAFFRNLRPRSHIEETKETYRLRFRSHFSREGWSASARSQLRRNLGDRRAAPHQVRESPHGQNAWLHSRGDGWPNLLEFMFPEDVPAEQEAIARRRRGDK